MGVVVRGFGVVVRTSSLQDTPLMMCTSSSAKPPSFEDGILACKIICNIGCHFIRSLKLNCFFSGSWLKIIIGVYHKSKCPT